MSRLVLASFFSAALVVVPAVAAAQATDSGAFPTATRSADGATAPRAAAIRTTTAPHIDGRLDDAAWTDAPVITLFIQRDPDEGVPSSEATEVRIAYDDEAMYIAARMHDRGTVTSRLGRRDMAASSSDWFRVSLDSFFDRRTAFRFEVNPAGVRRDAAISGGSGEGDLAWDAVWDAASTIDPEGWTTELRLPFSQLRFADADEQVWGLQLERLIDRRQELSMFSFTPKSEQGGVPSFGDLTGLRGIRPGRRLELLPYVLSQGAFSATPDNPFVGDNDFLGSAGLDARYRLTSNLTLTATANPDFGQVEVDPAVINLTAFETRFEERRPFFVEGASSFRFGGSVGGPSAAAASVLYSRRLGRAPQLGVGTSQVDAPDTATILGAVKLAGKTAGGWSLGVLNALTGAEHARFIDTSGATARGLVEPRTNYFVGRVNRELRRGQSQIGGIFTSANRDLAGDGRAQTLRADAYSGGVDFIHEWANRGWTTTGFLVGSRVTGSAASILATQRSSTRYYQRPDAGHIGLDPAATSMSGIAGSIQLRKSAGLHWTTDSWIQFVSPGYEINDVGFLQRSDRRAFGHGMTYNQRTPGRIWRDWRSTSYVNYAQNFDGDTIDHFYWTRLVLTHLSYWQVDGSVWYEPTRTDDRFTRGGPLAERPSVARYIGIVRSDVRQPVTGSLEYNLVTDRAGSRNRAWDLSISLRTSPRWNLSIGPRIQHVIQDAQYVTAIADPAKTETFGTRYIFARLDQTEASLVTRLNYTFTPDLSFELYAQPLVSNGDYGTPRQFERPSAYEFKTYGEDIGTIAREGSRYVIDPDASGPAASFSVSDRSFTTRSLRGNAVLRWEYRPGSTLYVVWQQDRLNDDRMADFGTTRAFGSLFGGDGRTNNVFAVKFSYWINP
jgi:hypothetical protein